MDGSIGDSVTMSSEESAHMTRVLRMKAGDKFILVDGVGGENICCISSVDNGLVSADVLEKRACEADPKVKITLYQACLKSDKLEFVLQKSVELGVSAYVPFVSSRCVKVPDSKGMQKMKTRMDKIAAEAVKQCGRAVLPEVGTAIRFPELIKRLEEHELVLFAYECETAPLKGTIGSAKDIALVIGPEGGFDLSEAEAIKTAGAVSVSLGKRILRAETAALALTAIVSYETGC